MPGAKTPIQADLTAFSSETCGFRRSRPAIPAGDLATFLSYSGASSMVTRSDFTASPWIWQMRGSLTPSTFAISR